MYQKFMKTRFIYLNCFQKLSTTVASEYHSNRCINKPLLYDVAIIGGGITGVAIGRQITQQSKAVKCILIEKENVVGKHQSSHNSGVVHSGIYYKPGSLKARLCSKGVDLIHNYCKENGIPYKTHGKLIVAKDHTETDALRCLFERGEKNNVGDFKMLWTKQDIKKIEPKCNGIQALWSPKTSNVNWGLVTNRFLRDFRQNGDVLLNNEVIAVDPSTDCNYPIAIKTNAGNRIKTKYLIISGGLQSGVLSSIIDEKDAGNSTFVSLKVEYQLLEKQSISTNIYGVPDVELPFLGVHISPRIDGSVLLGPAAIPAYEVEGYRDEFNFNYLKNIVNSINFQNMTRRYFTKCLKQVRSTFCRTFQVEQLQELAQIRAENVIPGPSAVQGVLINKDGSFVDDFIFEFFEGNGINRRIINCKFLPSPAATCSMSIAEFVARKFFQKYSE